MNLITLIHVHAEAPQLLDSCLGQFRRSYPASETLVIGDGVYGDYPRIARRHGAEFISGSLLKRTYRYPLWTDRFMRLALERPADWYLLLDPDTRVWRPFQVFPDADCVGSRLGSDEVPPNVNGCAALYRRAFVERYEAMSRDVWPDIHPTLREQMYFAQSYRHDMWMPYLARRMQATLADAGEVCAPLGGPAPLNPDLRFAATHPHRTREAWE
jgi:hypothetical protein